MFEEVDWWEKAVVHAHLRSRFPFKGLYQDPRDAFDTIIFKKIPSGTASFEPAHAN